MADRSKIEWTDATWNPVRARVIADSKIGIPAKVGFHCEHVSEGCRNCYAERQNMRGIFTGLPYTRPMRDEVEIFLDEKTLLQPLHWKRPRKIFLGSMTDVFGDFVPDAMLDKIFAVMALCPQHTLQVLTKRSARMRAYLSEPSRHYHIARPVLDLVISGKVPKHAVDDETWPVESEGDIDLPDDIKLGKWPLPNVWLGVSAEDQKTADERIPDLLATPAAIRWLSAEPLLGAMDLSRVGTLHALRIALPELVADHERDVRPNTVSGMQIDALGAPGQATVFYQTPDHMGGFAIRFPAPFPRLDWIVAGGESGPHARPMLIAWKRSLRDQCAAAGVPFLDKQWGEWIDADDWLRRLSRDGGCEAYGRRYDENRPLNFDEAASFAKDCGYPFEHQSDGSTMIRVGKRRAGRLLDGVEHNAFPEVPAHV
jgi:protein gp37